MGDSRRGGENSLAIGPAPIPLSPRARARGAHSGSPLVREYAIARQSPPTSRTSRQCVSSQQRHGLTAPTCPPPEPAAAEPCRGCQTMGLSDTRSTSTNSAQFRSTASVAHSVRQAVYNGDVTHMLHTRLRSVPMMLRKVSAAGPLSYRGGAPATSITGGSSHRVS